MEPPMSFDLLDRPLVYIPVKWAGVVADDNGDAVATEHEVSIQVEMLDEEEIVAWTDAANLDPFADDRAELAERVSAAIAKAKDGEDGTGATIRSLQRELDAINDKAKVAGKERDLASFKAVAKGWRGIVSRGRVVDFSDDNVRTLLLWPGFAAAFATAYHDAWQGKAKAREGNFNGSPAPGQAGEPTDATPKAATN
jgi:hypothetical protein